MSTCPNCGVPIRGQTVQEEKRAFTLLEDVLDTLVEVGNGVSDKDLHEAAAKLFEARKLLRGI